MNASKLSVKRILLAVGWYKIEKNMEIFVCLPPSTELGKIMLQDTEISRGFYPRGKSEISVSHPFSLVNEPWK